MGFRIPPVVISPYTRGKTPRSHYRVDHGTYGHESILKLISYRFGLGYLNKRHRYARNIGRSFDWTHADLDPPSLPDPPAIVTRPCGLGGGDVQDSAKAHENDLVTLEDLADRY